MVPLRVMLDESNFSLLIKRGVSDLQTAVSEVSVRDQLAMLIWSCSETEYCGREGMAKKSCSSPGRQETRRARKTFERWKNWSIFFISKIK